MKTGPLGLVDFDCLSENYRGAPGLMDYSLLVGVAPKGTCGGLAPLAIRSQKVQASNENESQWTTAAEEKVIFVGIIDILQFWTPKKRAARRYKKLVGMEGEKTETGEKLYNLDTCRPNVYKDRFIHFMSEVFKPCSWVHSLPRLRDGGWKSVLLIFFEQLPENQRARARQLKEEFNNSKPAG